MHKPFMLLMIAVALICSHGFCMEKAAADFTVFLHHVFAFRVYNSNELIAIECSRFFKGDFAIKQAIYIMIMALVGMFLFDGVLSGGTQTETDKEITFRYLKSDQNRARQVAAI